MSPWLQPTRLRWLQGVGLALVSLSAFWPVFHFRAYPVRGTSVPAIGMVYSADTGPRAGMGQHAWGPREVPVQEIGAAMVESARGPSRVGPFWERRRWYPYFLLPIWVLAFLLAGVGARSRRMAGGALWLLTLGVALFEAVYLRAEYAPFLQGGAGRVEGVLVWLFVLTILFYRRRADRRVGAVEATIASQALLAFVHALTLPSTMARGWLRSSDAGTVLESVWLNFPAAFWLGCTGFLVVALPMYLRRRGGWLGTAPICVHQPQPPGLGP